jgi:hypothetical protein
MVGTRKHEFLCSFLPRGRRCGPDLRCWCPSRVGRSSAVPCWTREPVGPFRWRFGRCSDLLSLLGGQLDVIEHGGKSASLSTVRPRRAGAKGPIRSSPTTPKARPARPDSGVITDPQAALGCRNA